MCFKSHLHIHGEFVLLNLLGLGKIWPALCVKLSAEGTTASHRQLGQERADAFLWYMDVPGLASAVSLGEQPEDPSIAAAHVVSPLINRDFLSLELAIFPWREYQQVGFQKHKNLLYPPATEIAECFTLEISRRRIRLILSSFENSTL